jgi:hypothetical protein
MITVRLLVSDLTGNLFEADADVVVDATFGENLTEMCNAMMADFLTVLRIELPEHAMLTTQRFLIPSKTGIVSLQTIIPH